MKSETKTLHPEMDLFLHFYTIPHLRKLLHCLFSPPLYSGPVLPAGMEKAGTFSGPGESIPLP
jgi:hypothetical protein